MSDEVKIVKFSVEDAIRIGGVELSDVARLNQIAGPCFSAIVDGNVVGCGGVRISGVGEAWALYGDKAKEMKLSLLKQTRIWLETIMREHSLHRIWSECPDMPNENFIKHLNFRKLDAYLRG